MGNVLREVPFLQSQRANLWCCRALHRLARIPHTCSTPHRFHVQWSVLAPSGVKAQGGAAPGDFPCPPKPTPLEQQWAAQCLHYVLSLNCFTSDQKGDKLEKLFIVVAFLFVFFFYIYKPRLYHKNRAQGHLLYLQMFFITTLTWHKKIFSFLIFLSCINRIDRFSGHLKLEENADSFQNQQGKAKLFLNTNATWGNFQKHITYKNSFVDRRASLMDLQKSKLKKENSLHCTMSSAGLIQNSTSTIVHQKNLSRMLSLSELDFVSGNLSKGQWIFKCHLHLRYRCSLQLQVTFQSSSPIQNLRSFFLIFPQHCQGLGRG